MATVQEIKIDLEEKSMRSLLDARTSKDCKIEAEGNSWFSYPVVKDVIDHLRQMGYAIKRHSKPHTIYKVIYPACGSRQYLTTSCCLQAATLVP